MNSKREWILGVTLKKQWESITLLLILIVALAVRVYGISYGLPYVGYQPDEYAVTDRALKMLIEGDLEPRHHPGPRLHEYVQYLVGRVALAYKNIQGHQVSSSDILVSGSDSLWGGVTNLPEYYLWGRFVVALLGTITVWLIYLLGKEVFFPKIGLISAVLFMCAPLHVINSHFITTTVPGTLFIVLACYCGFLAHKHDQWRYYILTGLAIGLAIYTKRNGRIALVPLGMLVVLKAKNIKSLGKIFITLLLACILAAPFLLLLSSDLKVSSFIDHVFGGIWRDGYVFGGSHPGYEGTNSWWWVVTTFLSSSWRFVFLFALGGIVWVLSRYGKKGIFLLAIPISYYLVVSFFSVRFDRWLVPLEPFLALFAGVFLWDIAKGLHAKAHLQWKRTAIIASLMGLVVFITAGPMVQAFEYGNGLLKEDSRTVAARWIESHIPQRKSIAVERYGPVLMETSYKVTRVGSLIEHDLAWYLEKEIDYVIASSQLYKRFYKDMDKYRAEVEQYEELFNGFFLEQKFSDVGPTIQIYRAKPLLLSSVDVEGILHRSNIFFEGKAELVGYDLSSEEVQPGETLWVTLYWRALRKMERDYTVSVELWGRDDQIIGQRDMDSGMRTRLTSQWQPYDVFAETYSVTISREALSPSLCRIEVFLYDQEAAARLRTYDKDMNRLGHAFIAPIKISPVEPLQFLRADAERHNLGNKIALIGYDLDKKVARPGDSLHLTLYWEALADMREDYTVFTHLIDDRNHIWGQEDSQPLDGYYPTTLWEVGEVVKDEYCLTVQPDAPDGEYRIEVGIYLLSTGERLPLLGERSEELDNRIVLERISVH